MKTILFSIVAVLALAASSFAQVAGQFSITFGGNLSGSNYNGVVGTFSDPSVAGYQDTDVDVGDFVAEKRNDGSFWAWKIVAINSTAPLNINVTPAGDHTARPVGALQTGDGAISEAKGANFAWVPPFSLHGINSNLISVFENLNDSPSAIAVTTQDLLLDDSNDDGETVTVTGYYSAGDGISLEYEWDAASTAQVDGVDATHPGLVVKPTDTVGAGRWIAKIEQDYINVKWFGALGDNVQDDTLFIQRAFDVANYSSVLWTVDWNVQKVFIPSGDYKITETIQALYGDTFRHLTIEGGDGATPYTLGDGAIIYPTFTDRPCLVIQGGRAIAVRGLSFIGSVSTALGFAHPVNNKATWDALGANYADGINNPFCAIAIDPYSGAKPGLTPYPEPVIPAGLGITSWSRSHTSAVTIADCKMQYFATGIAVKPSGGSGFDNNGDFVTVRNCTITYCKYGMTADGSQTRQNLLDNCKFHGMYSCIAGGVYGAQLTNDLIVLKSSVGFSAYIMWTNKAQYCGNNRIAETFAEGLGCVAYTYNSSGSSPMLVLRDNDIRFLNADDTSQNRWHVDGRNCVVSLTGNSFFITHGIGVTRPLMTVFSDARPVSMASNTIQYQGSALLDQETFARQLNWGIAGTPVPSLDCVGNYPPVMHWQHISGFPQTTFITSGYTLGTTGSISGVMYNLNGQGPGVNVGDFIHLRQYPQIANGWWFKVTSKPTDTDVVMQLINECDAAGDPLDAANLSTALQTGTTYAAVNRGQTLGVGDEKYRKSIYFGQSISNATPATIDASRGKVTMLTLNELTENLVTISNLEVGATHKAIVTKTNDWNSLALYTPANFTAPADLEQMTALFPAGEPFVIEFTRTKLGSANGGIFVELRSRPIFRSMFPALFHFSTSATTADPGIAYIRLNNVTPSLANEIYVNIEDMNGFEIDGFLAGIVSGTKIRIVGVGNEAKGSLYTATGVVTDNTGWYTIPVSFNHGDVRPDNSQVCGLQFF